MPNQRDPSKQHTSITLPRTLVGKLDKIAEGEERSRAQVIELLLRKQIAEYDEKAGLASQVPPLGTPSEEVKATIRKRHGSKKGIGSSPSSTIKM